MTKVGRRFFGPTFEADTILTTKYNEHGFLILFPVILLQAIPINPPKRRTFIKSKQCSNSPVGDIVWWKMESFAVAVFPHTTLRCALLGPGPCLLRALPSRIVKADGEIVQPTAELVETVLSQLQLFVKGLDLSASKPNIDENYLMAIRLYTMEDPIPFHEFVKEPLNGTDRQQKFPSIAPFMRLLTQALEVFGEAGYSVQSAGCCVQSVEQDSTESFLQKYSPVGRFVTLPGITRVSRNMAPIQGGNGLLFSMESVHGIDVSSLSARPNQHEILLIPPVVMKVETFSHSNGTLSVGLKSMRQRDNNLCCSDLPSVHSAFCDEFGSVYNALRCGDRNTWDRMHTYAIDNNDPLAQAILSIGYFRGFFVVDTEVAFLFAQKCLSWLHCQVDKNSYFCLGEFYEEGIAVKVDQMEAVRLWKLAAEAGSELAQSSLAFYLKNTVHQEQDAAELYRLAADAGFCVAQYNFGLLSSLGRGCPQDFAEAVKWYRLAADQGYPSAQNNLGCAYRDGEGVLKDIAQSTSYFLLAAFRGHPSSQYNLGCIYYDGDDVDVDFIEAVKWFHLAALNGDSDAQTMMGKCCRHGLGTVMNYAAMIKWFQLAVAQDDMFAQHDLAWCYEQGLGVNKDMCEAVRLYTLSSEQGFEAARDRLSILQA